MDTKLHEAVRYSDKEGVLEALKENFDPNVLGLLRWSPVQEAARTGDREILFHLLEHGGDPNLPDGLCSRNTALHFAAAEGHLECLRLLLRYGGDLSLLNAERKSCLQFAPPECKEAVSKLITESGGKRKAEHKHGEGDMIGQHSSETDKWNTLPRVPSKTEMGFLHLSFEYHKESLKVRVWQISDLLLPPPQISMIHSIFVRAYFMPDKARKSHRRTEDIVLDLPESTGGVETPKTGIQHIFTPSSFKFRTPLLYRAVTEAVVKERSLQLEVCMTQKRSHRTFLIAMVHMPLRTAVRRPIREKYPLIPCMNLTIPNNMRVYSAAQLQLESSKGSNSPSIQRMTSPAADSPEVPVTAREVELEDVVSLSGEDFVRSHLSLCLDQDSDSEGVERQDGGRLTEVTVSNGVGGSGGSSTTTLNMQSSGDDLGDTSDDDDDTLPTIITDQGGLHSRSTPIDMSGVENSVATAHAKKKIIPNELLKGVQDVTVEMPSEETVVDIDCLYVPSHNTTTTTQTHRKIQPGGVGNDAVTRTQTLHGTIGDQNRWQDSAQSKTPLKQNVSDSPRTGASRKKIMVLPGEIDLPSGQRSSRSKSMSQSSQVSSSGSESQSPQIRRGPGCSPIQDSAFTPASRPETPCWDFYDWSEDLHMEEGGLELSSKTLEDSLAQLRQQGTGCVQNLSKEPILPMDLADDFDSLTVDGEQSEKL
ncbi:hypothetical protein ACOMHN_045560 [Nucella lapillus]